MDVRDLLKLAIIGMLTMFAVNLAIEALSIPEPPPALSFRPAPPFCWDEEFCLLEENPQ